MTRSTRFACLVAIVVVGWHGDLFSSTVAHAPGKEEPEDAVAARRFLAAAQEAAKELQKPTDTACAYRAIAAAQAKAGNLADARRSLETARAAAAQITDAEAKTGAYITIANAETECGDAKSARLSLREARAAAMLLDDNGVRKSDCLLEIAEAYAKAGDVTETRHVGKEAVAAAAQAGNDHKPFVVERVVEAMIAATDFAGAKAAAALLTDEDCQSKNTDKSGDGNNYALWSKIRAYVAIATAQAEVGDILNAETTMLMLREKEIEASDETCSQRDRGYAAIAAALARGGNMKAALKSLTRIKVECVRIGAHLQVAEACEKARNAKDARQSLTAMQAALHRFRGTPDAYLYNECGLGNDVMGICLAVAQARLGDYAAAKATAIEFDQDFMRSTAYSLIARAEARAGDGTGARKTLESARAAADLVPQGMYRAADYLDLACVLAEIGDKKAAREILAAASENPLDDNVPLYVQIAATQVSLSDAAGASLTLKRAEAALAESSDSDWSRGIMSEIAVVAARNGSVEDVVALIARTIDDRAARSEALADIAKELLEPWTGPNRGGGMNQLWRDSNRPAK